MPEENEERSRRKRRRSPLPICIIHEIATNSMAQIVVNMSSPELRAECLNYLQTNDDIEADKRISNALTNIELDAKASSRLSKDVAACIKRAK